MEKIVDARGLTCPQPVIKAKEALKNMAEGTLKVLVDNEIAVQNVMKLGKYEGLAPVSEKKGEEEFEILFHVDKKSGDTEETAPEAECIPDARKKGLGRAFIRSDGGRQRRAWTTSDEGLCLRSYPAGRAS